MAYTLPEEPRALLSVAGMTVAEALAAIDAVEVAGQPEHANDLQTNPKRTPAGEAGDSQNHWFLAETGGFEPPLDLSA